MKDEVSSLELETIDVLLQSNKVIDSLFDSIKWLFESAQVNCKKVYFIPQQAETTTTKSIKVIGFIYKKKIISITTV